MNGQVVMKVLNPHPAQRGSGDVRGEEDSVAEAFSGFVSLLDDMPEIEHETLEHGPQVLGETWRTPISPTEGAAPEQQAFFPEKQVLMLLRGGVMPRPAEGDTGAPMSGKSDVSQRAFLAPGALPGTDLSHPHISSDRSMAFVSAWVGPLPEIAVRIVETHLAPASVSAAMITPASKADAKQSETRVAPDLSLRPPAALTAANDAQALPGDTQSKHPAQERDQPNRGPGDALKPLVAATEAKPTAAVTPSGTSATPTPQTQIADASVDALPQTFTVEAPPSSFRPAPSHRSSVRVLQVELQPASLGMVTVTLSMRDDAVSVTVSASNPTTAAMLSADSRQIAESLNNAGYTVEAITVQTVTRSEAAAMETRPDPGGADHSPTRDEASRRNPQHGEREPPKPFSGGTNDESEPVRGGIYV